MVSADAFEEDEILEAQRNLQAASLDILRVIEPANHIHPKENMLILSVPSFTNDGRKVIEEIASKGKKACDLGLPASCGKIIQPIIQKLPKAILAKATEDPLSIKALKEAGLIIESPGIDEIPDLKDLEEFHDLFYPHYLPTMRLLTDLKNHTGEEMFPCVICGAPVGYGFVCPVDTCAGCMHFSCIRDELSQGFEGCKQCNTPFPVYLTHDALEALARQDAFAIQASRYM